MGHFAWEAAAAVAAVAASDESFEGESAAARNHAERWLYDEILPQWATMLRLPTGPQIAKAISTGATAIPSTFG